MSINQSSFFTLIMVISIGGCTKSDLDSNATTVRMDPCIEDFKERLKDTMVKNPEFSSTNIVFRFSFLSEDLSDLQKVSGLIRHRIKIDTLWFDRIFVEEFMSDSLYRVQWIQHMSNDPQVYCEQFHYSNYLRLRYGLFHYSDITGTIKLNKANV